jgi:hypothetical protein
MIHSYVEYCHLFLWSHEPSKSYNHGYNDVEKNKFTSLLTSCFPNIIPCEVVFYFNAEFIFHPYCPLCPFAQKALNVYLFP